MANVQGDGYEVTIEREMYKVSEMSEPDPNWRFVDAAGHEHRYAPDGSVPTTESVSLGVYWCEICNDEHEDFELRCLLCGERVIPGTRTPIGPRHVAGPSSVTAVFTVRFKDFQRLADAGPDERFDIDLADLNARLIGARVVAYVSDFSDESKVTVVADSVEEL